MSVRWHGVIPAITTPFASDLSVDHAFLAAHAGALVDAGCSGIVAGGSLGEAASLSDFEKLDVLRTLVAAVGERAGVVAGVAAAATAQAVTFAKDAAAEGAAGLMVLPPYVYRGDDREMLAHVSAVIGATDLPCMLYNNPVAYGTDFLPAQIAMLAAEHENLMAVKESSTDVRRSTAIRALTGDRLALLVGVDDAIVEGVAAGARGWIAGLANALPRESVLLLELARRGDAARTHELYRWFLPLLRLDTMPKFVQLIKRVQARVGLGSDRVRPPRLPLTPDEAREVDTLVERAVAARPAVETWGALPD